MCAVWPASTPSTRLPRSSEKDELVSCLCFCILLLSLSGWWFRGLSSGSFSFSMFDHGVQNRYNKLVSVTISFCLLSKAQRSVGLPTPLFALVCSGVFHYVCVFHIVICFVCLQKRWRWSFCSWQTFLLGNPFWYLTIPFRFFRFPCSVALLCVAVLLLLGHTDLLQTWVVL